MTTPIDDASLLIAITQRLGSDPNLRFISLPILESLILKISDCTICARDVTRTIETLVDRKILEPSSPWIFRNSMFDHPDHPVCSVVVDELAPFLCKGSMVSLQRSLGIHGVANNPSRVITAIAPIPNIAGKNQSEFHVGDQEIWVWGVPESIFSIGDEEDRLSKTWHKYAPPVLMATPEKALTDWIYLSMIDAMSPPSLIDHDLSELNLARLTRLAENHPAKDLIMTWLQDATLAQEFDWDDYASRRGLKF